MYRPIRFVKRIDGGLPYWVPVCPPPLDLSTVPCIYYFPFGFDGQFRSAAYFVQVGTLTSNDQGTWHSNLPEAKAQVVSTVRRLLGE